MDFWIEASLHNLIKYVHQEMAAYRLYTVVPALVKYIEQLTKWYVRLNRSRLKGSEGVEDVSTIYFFPCLIDIWIIFSNTITYIDWKSIVDPLRCVVDTGKIDGAFHTVLC